ncbi:MAG: hypothetical protein EAZ70_13560 [Runella slithyformis]|nr:MAG: hypothetical protein EAY79_00205 [Runella slithyformis]TAF93227.1 MAG: hypothetical protein EAZ46_12620 [Runella sp.]TAG20007.1 MAG: hypothetical protein EAZ38_11210 [Cytophagales bacterium]TAG38028.1 MAG: hypothetical protein EAZ32_13540 [Cytophagia bacterium]TAF01443.1 MAG: hypothetical protein EAZ80_02715 [Runella slithyformis]
MKYFLQLLLLFSYCLHAQDVIPDTISRSSVLNPTSLKRDSAIRYIQLKPGFSVSATGAGSYQTVIIPLYIEWPKPGQIIQRDNTNNAWLYVKGKCTDSSVGQIEAKAVPVQGGTTKTKVLNVVNGIYEGALQLIGGDYRIEVREIKGVVAGNIIYGRLQSVERVGVGEVLLIWGHSFMGGDTYSEPANDPRVRTVVTLRNPLIPNEPSRLQDFSILPYKYQQIGLGDIGPFAGRSWMWAAFGDTLAQRLNVPILLYSAAFGGSAVWHNDKNIKNEPFGFDWFGYLDQYRMPYRPVEATFERYTPVSGIRGILSGHGGNDRSPMFAPTFYNNFVNVINNTRTLAQHPQLSYFISYESSNSIELQFINNEISNLLNNVPHTLQGIDLRPPSTDNPLWRKPDGHFLDNTAGHHKYLEYWVNAVPNSFFTTSTPKMANVPEVLKTP